MSSSPSHRKQSSQSSIPPAPAGSSPSVFEQQREELVGEIALSLEQVLQNLNRLNRNLEGVIAVGNEFSSVEALWSQFENVMGKDVEEGEGGGNGNGNGGEGGDGGNGGGN